MKKNLLVLFVALLLVMVGCSSKSTLSKWVDSDEVAAVQEQINAAYAEAGLGLRVKFSADSEDVLVFSYIYDIRVQCVNSDGTVIYSQEYVNTK